MRLTLIALLALAGCASSGGPDNDPQFDANCAEQAAMAQNGTTEGAKITITCP